MSRRSDRSQRFTGQNALNVLIKPAAVFWLEVNSGISNRQLSERIDKCFNFLNLFSLDVMYSDENDVCGVTL